MSEKGFFVTLPSNASAKVYPQNKIWNYRTKLASPILLTEAYEVGLVEIQYPQNWYSFPESDATISINNSLVGKITHISLPVGHYDRVSDILSEFNSLAVQSIIGGKISLEYDRVRKRVWVKGDQHIALSCGGKLAHILGFISNDPLSPSENTQARSYAPHPADIYGGCYSMFIYSDIVDYQVVGDSYVPLLRSINIADTDKQYPIRLFDKPHYVRLSKLQIDDIEIAIKSDQDQPIPFTYGKVVIKLHFRPIKQLL